MEAPHHRSEEQQQLLPRLAGDLSSGFWSLKMTWSIQKYSICSCTVDDFFLALLTCFAEFEERKRRSSRGTKGLFESKATRRKRRSSSTEAFSMTSDGSRSRSSRDILRAEIKEECFFYVFFQIPKKLCNSQPKPMKLKDTKNFAENAPPSGPSQPVQP